MPKYNFSGRRPLTRDVDVTIELLEGKITDSRRQSILETSKALKYLPYARTEKGNVTEYPSHIQIRPYKHAKTGEIFFDMKFTMGEGSESKTFRDGVSQRSLDKQLRRMYEQLS